MTNRVVIIYRGAQQADRWFTGDYRWRAPIRRFIRGPDKTGGIDFVFLNLCAGLDRLGIQYVANPLTSEIRPSDWVGVIGRDRECLNGYAAPNPLVTGVAVAAHPAEWPALFEDYPVACNLVHCSWVKAMNDPWYGAERVRTWPVGIDTELWAPARTDDKSIDFLVYDKIMWDTERVQRALRDPILLELDRRSLKYEIIRYGSYRPAELKEGLCRARALLFLCEHGERLQSLNGMRSVVTNWTHLQIYRKAEPLLIEQEELTPRRKRAMTRVLWPLAHWIAYTPPAEAAEVVGWIYQFDPEFSPPESGLLGAIYRHLGFAATEWILRIRRHMLAPMRKLRPESRVATPKAPETAMAIECSRGRRNKRRVQSRADIVLIA
jgi:hypothetical protein